MRLSDARAITDYWLDAPPENESLANLASAFTSWKPGKPVTTEQEAQLRLRKQQEARWKSGQAMNAKQILEALGGGGRAVSFSIDGKATQASVITDFPGVTVH